MKSASPEHPKFLLVYRFIGYWFKLPVIGSVAVEKKGLPGAGSFNVHSLLLLAYFYSWFMQMILLFFSILLWRQVLRKAGHYAPINSLGTSLFLLAILRNSVYAACFCRRFDFLPGIFLATWFYKHAHNSEQRGFSSLPNVWYTGDCNSSSFFFSILSILLGHINFDDPSHRWIVAYPVL